MFRLKVDDDISLRLHEERHAPELFALTEANRAYLRRWLGWSDATRAVEDTRAHIRETLLQFARGEGLTTGVLYRGALVGAVGLTRAGGPARKAEIGYWLAEDAQGKGIMTRACRALVDYAFDELDLNRVWIEAAVDNHRSRAVPERLGFRQEGVLRQSEWNDGRFLDMAVYGLLAEEWRAR